MSGHVRRGATLLVTLTLSAFTMAGPASGQQAAPEVVRLAGLDRIATAASISAQTYPAGTETVVLARADAYPDALAGAPLAAVLRAPILLTDPARLSLDTADEVERLGADRAVLLGGPAALSPTVADDLAGQGVQTVERVAGASRYETAARIAALVREGMPRGSDAFVVEGDNPDPARGWPDAVAVAGYAAAIGAPILLTGRNSAPLETLDVICAEGLRAVVVGGEAAVSRDVATQVSDCDQDGRANQQEDRIAGADRYATSRQIADEAVSSGADIGRAWLASGSNYPDALAAGPAAAAELGVLMLIDGGSQYGMYGSGNVTELLLSEVPVAAFRLAGGEAVISERIQRDLEYLVGIRDPSERRQFIDLQEVPHAEVAGVREQIAETRTVHTPVGETSRNGLQWNFADDNVTYGLLSTDRAPEIIGQMRVASQLLLRGRSSDWGETQVANRGGALTFGLSWAAQCLESCVDPDPDYPLAGIIWEGEPSDGFIFDPVIRNAGRHVDAGSYRYGFIYRWEAAGYTWITPGLETPDFNCPPDKPPDPMMEMRDPCFFP